MPNIATAFQDAVSKVTTAAETAVWKSLGYPSYEAWVAAGRPSTPYVSNLTAGAQAAPAPLQPAPAPVDAPLPPVSAGAGALTLPPGVPRMQPEPDRGLLGDVLGAAGSVAGAVGKLPIDLESVPLVGPVLGQGAEAIFGSQTGRSQPNVSDVFNAYNTDIPVYSDVARETLVPAARDVGGLLANAAVNQIPGLGVVNRTLQDEGLPSAGTVGQEVGGALVPVTLGDVIVSAVIPATADWADAYRLAKSAGLIDDAGRVVSGVTRGQLDNVLRRAGKTIDDLTAAAKGGEQGFARVPFGPEDAGRQADEGAGLIDEAAGLAGPQPPLAAGESALSTPSPAALPDEASRAVTSAEGVTPPGTAGASPAPAAPPTTPPGATGAPGASVTPPGGGRGGVAVAEGATPDPVSRLTDVINTTRRLPPQTEALRTQARRQRVAMGASALESGGRTPEAFRAARGALAGELPRVQFEAPLMNFSPEDIQGFRNRIGSSNLRFFEELNAETALTKVLDGQLNEVTPSEIDLLSRVFGPDMAKAVADRQGIKWGEELISALGAPRTLKASFDLSAPGRQGLALGVRHPQEWLESWVPMVKAWGSENKSREAFEMAEALMRGWRDKFGDDLVHLYDDIERVPGFEPQGRSRIATWLRKIPGLRNSERAFSTFLNVQKAKTFNTMATALERAGVDDPEQYRNLAAIIDHATGFGAAPLNKSTAGQLGGQTFFSQRLNTARVQFLVDPIVEGLAKGDLRTARAATENLVAFFGAQLGVLALGHEAGLWDAEFDPRSTDFGKIRIGPQRIDPMAGFSPLIRQAYRVATGERKSLTGDVFPTSSSTEALRFFQNKLAPVPSVLVSLASGQTNIGEKPSVRGVMRDLFMPMFVDSFIEGLNTGGLEGALIGTLPETVGLGTLSYGAGQAAQADIARHEYKSEYDDLHAREQAEINAQAAADGVEMEWRDRQAPWWTAREDGMQRWLADIVGSDSELAQDPFVQQAQQVSKYADLATELSSWAQETYGISRIEAEKAVDRFLRETRLQDYINAYRKEALDADPEMVQAWDEAYQNGDVEYAPAKWVREFVAEMQAPPSNIQQMPRMKTSPEFSIYEDGSTEFEGNEAIAPARAGLAEATGQGFGTNRVIETNAATQKVIAAEALRKNGIDERFASLTPATTFNPTERPYAGAFTPGINRIELQNTGPTDLLAGANSGVVMHENAHAFEANLSPDETAELARLMEKYPTVLTQLGFADQEYHAGALTRYFDQLEAGWGLPGVQREPNDAFISATAGTPRIRTLPPEIIRFINEHLPLVLNRIQESQPRAAAGVPNR